MFEPSLQLSDDLEWMLPSDQVSNELLAQVLVERYYTDIYRLALALLEDRQMAHDAVMTALIKALAERYRYLGQEPAKVWLFRIVMDTLMEKGWRQQHRSRLDPTDAKAGILPPQSGLENPDTPAGWRAAAGRVLDDATITARAVVILHLLNGWSLETTAKLGPEMEAADGVLDSLRSQVHSVLEANGENPKDQDIDAVVRQVVSERWPAPALSPVEQQEITQELVRQAGKRSRQARRAAFLREILILMAGAATFIAIVLVSATIESGPDGGSADRSTRTPMSRDEQRSLVSTWAAGDRMTRAAPTGRPTPTSVAMVGLANSPSVTITAGPGETLESIGLEYGVPVIVLRAFNGILPGEEIRPGQKILLPLRATATPTEVPLPEGPLEADTDPDLLVKILQARWESLDRYWMDAWITLDRPLGFAGQRQAYRSQFWTDQTGGRYTVLSGSPDGPVEIFLRNPEGVYGGGPGNVIPLESVQSEVPTAFYGSYLRLLQTRFLRIDWQVGTPEVVGLEDTPRGNTLVVDHYNLSGRREARLWLEQNTAFPLRQQYFSPHDPERVQIDIITLNFEFKPPEAAFQPDYPWQDGFVENARLRWPGQSVAPEFPDDQADIHRSTPPYDPPADGFDPGRMALDFRFNQSYKPVGSGVYEIQTAADIFADGYFLGNWIVGDPDTTLCSRSPDGNILALAYEAWVSDQRTRVLRWLDLRSPGQIYQVGNQGLGQQDERAIDVGQLAFSPNGNRLAIFRRLGRVTPYISVIDLSDGNIVNNLRLNNLERSASNPVIDVRSLVWRPDGRALAMIVRLGSLEDQVIVVDLDTEAVVYRRSVDFNTGNRAEWPPLEWGIEFPVEQGDLETCAQGAGGN